MKKKSFLEEEQFLALEINKKGEVQEEQEEQMESLKETLDLQSEDEKS